MNEIENTIAKSLRNIGDRIGETIRNKGLADTGQSQEFEIRFEKDSVQLLGADYLYYLDQGRAPGNFPPVDSILEYVERKNITFEGMTSKQVAYLIGRSIAQKGTAIYRDKSKGIELDRILGQELNKIYDDIGDAAVRDAKTFLKI